MSKRRFFQLHLSTAVVLMLVASVLVWANVRGQDVRQSYPEQKLPLLFFGWPRHYRIGVPAHLDFSPDLRNAFENHFWSTGNAAFNSLIALAILLSVWQLSEWRIRRREAK